jgi:hypothetical protein
MQRKLFRRQAATVCVLHAKNGLRRELAHSAVSFDGYEIRPDLMNKLTS